MLLIRSGTLCISVLIVYYFSFKIPGDLKPIRSTWNVEWTVEDDTNLLRGIYMYGFGSWDVMKLDKDLKLTDKMLDSDLKKLPQARHLVTRAEAVLKYVQKYLDRNPNEIVNRAYAKEAASKGSPDKSGKGKRKTKQGSDKTALNADSILASGASRSRGGANHARHASAAAPSSTQHGGGGSKKGQPAKSREYIENDDDSDSDDDRPLVSAPAPPVAVELAGSTKKSAKSAASKAGDAKAKEKKPKEKKSKSKPAKEAQEKKPAEKSSPKEDKYSLSQVQDEKSDLFKECKNIMKPMKAAIRKLNAVESGIEIRDCLLVIGNHIEASLESRPGAALSGGSGGKKQRDRWSQFLWEFVSMLTSDYEGHEMKKFYHQFAGKQDEKDEKKDASKGDKDAKEDEKTKKSSSKPHHHHGHHHHHSSKHKRKHKKDKEADGSTETAEHAPQAPPLVGSGPVIDSKTSDSTAASAAKPQDTSSESQKKVKDEETGSSKPGGRSVKNEPDSCAKIDDRDEKTSPRDRKSPRDHGATGRQTKEDRKRDDRRRDDRHGHHGKDHQTGGGPKDDGYPAAIGDWQPATDENVPSGSGEPPDGHRSSDRSNRGRDRGDHRERDRDRSSHRASPPGSRAGGDDRTRDSRGDSRRFNNSFNKPANPDFYRKLHRRSDRRNEGPPWQEDHASGPTPPGGRGYNNQPYNDGGGATEAGGGGYGADPSNGGGGYYRSDGRSSQWYSGDGDHHRFNNRHPPHRDQDRSNSWGQRPYDRSSGGEGGNRYYSGGGNHQDYYAGEGGSGPPPAGDGHYRSDNPHPPQSMPYPPGPAEYDHNVAAAAAQSTSYNTGGGGAAPLFGAMPPNPHQSSSSGSYDPSPAGHTPDGGAGYHQPASSDSMDPSGSAGSFTQVRPGSSSGGYGGGSGGKSEHPVDPRSSSSHSNSSHKR